MEYYWKLIKFKLLMKKKLLVFILFICLICSIFTIKYSKGAILSVSLFSGQADFRFQGNELVEIYEGDLSRSRFAAGSRRKLLGGPGSSPPRCLSKCGRCTPCQPVHVPVPPGTPVTAEYYPEAWRCKCGNKLYMP